MSQTNGQEPESRCLHERVFRPATSSELAEAIERAFDYRGDVTLELTSGATIEGYLFNRDSAPPHPHVQLFPKNEAGMKVVSYEEIVAISFTGADTASGKSWEAWVAKKESQRKAEAEQVAHAARARGHL